MRIFLWENDVDAAWAEARAGGCAQDLRLDLAARREKDDPEEVLIVYQAQLEPALDRRENETYRESKALLRTVRGLLIRLGRASEFGDRLTALRLAHKRRRNFMTLLDHASGRSVVLNALLDSPTCPRCLQGEIDQGHQGLAPEGLLEVMYGKICKLTSRSRL